VNGKAKPKELRVELTVDLDFYSPHLVSSGRRVTGVSMCSNFVLPYSPCFATTYLEAWPTVLRQGRTSED